MNHFKEKKFFLKNQLRFLFIQLSMVSFSIALCSCINFSFKEVKPKAFPSPRDKKQNLKELKNQNPASPATLKKLQTFINENQNNDSALKAILYMGEILRKQNKKGAACRVYKQVLSLPFSYTGDIEAFFLYSDCLFKSKKITEALELLEAQFELASSPELKKKIIKKQWSFLKHSRKKLTFWRLLTLNRLEEYNPPTQKSKWIKKGMILIDALTEQEILNLEGNLSTLNAFQGVLLFKAGQREWKNRNFKKAKEYFQKAVKTSSLKEELSKKAKGYLRTINARLLVNPHLIGVILPLTGHRKALGEKVLKGLNLGLGLTDNSPWQLIVMDSDNHPDVTQQAMETLLYTYHVIGVIGGLSGDTAQVIAKMGEEWGIPSLLLSQKQSLAEDRLFIFQSGLSGKELINHLTENLIRNLKITKTALLFPKDNYGKTYARLFRKAFLQKGGSVISEESYKPEEVDFKTPIKKLVNLFNLKSRAREYETLKQKFLEKNPNLSERHKKLSPDYLLKPEVNFQALFIPDSLNVLKRITSYLKYFNIKDIHLIGTNLWKKEKLKNWNEDFPLVFSDTADVPQDVFLNSPFYLKYRKAFQASPGFFEKQAYNTALALKTALSKNPKDRFQLQKALEKVKTFKGAFFNIKITKGHTFSHPLKFYKIHPKTGSIQDSIPVP